METLSTPLKLNVYFSVLISRANQLTGFYMMGTLVVKELTVKKGEMSSLVINTDFFLRVMNQLGNR